MADWKCPHQHRYNLYYNPFNCLLDCFNRMNRLAKHHKSLPSNPLILHCSGVYGEPDDHVCPWRGIHTYHGTAPGPLPKVFHLLHKVVAGHLWEHGEPVHVRAGLEATHRKHLCQNPQYCMCSCTTGNVCPPVILRCLRLFKQHLLLGHFTDYLSEVTGSEFCFEYVSLMRSTFAGSQTNYTILIKNI